MRRIFLSFTLTTCCLKIPFPFWTLRPGDLGDEDESKLSQQNYTGPGLSLTVTEVSCLCDTVLTKPELIEKDWVLSPKPHMWTPHTHNSTLKEQKENYSSVYLPQRSEEALISNISSVSPASKSTKMHWLNQRWRLWVQHHHPMNWFDFHIWVVFLEHRITTLWNANCFCYPAWLAWKMRCKLRHNIIIAALTLF